MEDYQYILLQIKGVEGFLIAFVCPVIDKSIVSVSVNDGTSFTIGNAGGNAIHCNNPLFTAKNSEFKYHDNIWYVEDLNSNYGTYINGKLITTNTRLYHGDVVFILGLKFIVLNNNLYFNNPYNSVRYDKSIFKEAKEREKLPELDFKPDDDSVELQLYGKKDYFVRSPRFFEKNETVPFMIDKHPGLPVDDDTPLILTAGPMLTMGMSSVTMLMSSVMNYQSNGNLMSVIPSGVMSVSMLAGTLLWPSLTKKYQKNLIF